MRLLASSLLVLVIASTAAFAGVVETVTETKSLRVGYRTDAPPFSYEPASGDIRGYSVDLCRAVADMLKTELQLPAVSIEYVPVTAESRFQALIDGKVDILCGATTETLSRRKDVDFSLPTFIDGTGLMVRDAASITSLADLADKKLAVLAGTTTEQALHVSFPNATVTAVTSHNEGVQGLLDEKFDAYFADRTVLEYLRRNNERAQGLQIADEYLTIEPYALALPLGDTRFRLLVDTALSRLFRSQQMGQIVDAAFGGAKLGNMVRALYRIVPLPE
jgi:ABC-type amino acid transport substrate-binding protein